MEALICLTMQIHSRLHGDCFLEFFNWRRAGKKEFFGFISLLLYFWTFLIGLILLIIFFYWFWVFRFFGTCQTQHHTVKEQLATVNNFKLWWYILFLLLIFSQLLEVINTSKSREGSGSPETANFYVTQKKKKASNYQDASLLENKQKRRFRKV